MIFVLSPDVFNETPLISPYSTVECVTSFVIDMSDILKNKTNSSKYILLKRDLIKIKYKYFYLTRF